MVTTFLWTKQAQSNQWTQGLFLLFLSCYFPSNAKYSVLVLYGRGTQHVGRMRPAAAYFVACDVQAERLYVHFDMATKKRKVGDVADT